MENDRMENAPIKNGRKCTHWKIIKSNQKVTMENSPHGK